MEMQRPGTILVDASIKRVAFSAVYACVDKVHNTVLNRNFVTFIDRKQTRYGMIPDQGYTFNQNACYACRTDAGIRT